MSDETRRKRPQNKRINASKKNRVASGVKETSGKRLVMWVAGSIVACFVVASLLVAIVNKDKNEVKSQILKHLRDTYGTEQFVIKDIKLNGGGFGVNGIWQGVAYSKDSGLEFYVAKGERSEISTDSYTNVTWAKEETERTAPGVKKIIPTAETVKISMGVDKDFLKTLENPLGSYARVRRDNQEYLSYTLKVINKGELPDAATVLFRSVEQMKASGLKEVSVLYVEKYPGKANMYGRTCTDDKTHSIESINKCISDKVIIEEDRIR